MRFFYDAPITMNSAKQKKKEKILIIHYNDSKRFIDIYLTFAFARINFRNDI